MTAPAPGKGKRPFVASARSIAAQVVARVEKDGAFAAASLDTELTRAAQLAPRDRGLATELAYGTLRVRPWLDARIERHAKRGIKGLEPRARAHLEVAAYQIFFLARVPSFAAVSEAVDLVRAVTRPAGRRVRQRRPARALGGGDARDAARGGGDRRLDGPVAEERARAGDRRGRRGPVPRERRGAPAARDPCGGHGRPRRMARAPPRGRPRRDVRARARLPRGDPRPGRRQAAGLPGWAEGEWSVQEEGSQLVALSLGARAGETVLDACAGRGNKTGALAGAVGPRGAVDAADLHPAKLEAPRRNLARTRRTVRACHPVDWSVGSGDVPRDFDRVLVDAPCSGRRDAPPPTGSPDPAQPRETSRRSRLSSARSSSAPPTTCAQAGGSSTPCAASFARRGRTCVASLLAARSDSSSRRSTRRTRARSPARRSRRCASCRSSTGPTGTSWRASFARAEGLEAPPRAPYVRAARARPALQSRGGERKSWSPSVLAPASPHGEMATMLDRRHHAPARRERVRRDDHQVARSRGGHRQEGPAPARDCDRQGRQRAPRADRGARGEAPREGGGRRRGEDARLPDRGGGRRRAPSRAPRGASSAPCSRRRRHAAREPRRAQGRPRERRESRDAFTARASTAASGATTSCARRPQSRPATPRPHPPAVAPAPALTTRDPARAAHQPVRGLRPSGPGRRLRRVQGARRTARTRGTRSSPSRGAGASPPTT